MVIRTGSYRHQRDENFITVLEKCGTSYMLRKLCGKVGPHVTILKGEDNDSYVIRTTLLMRTVDWVFTLGESVKLWTPPGYRTFVFTEENGALVQTPDSQGPERVKVIREFTDQGMTVTLIHMPTGTIGRRFFVNE